MGQALGNPVSPPQSPATMPPLLELIREHERYYPIYKNIISLLEASDIIQLQLVCKQLSSVYQDALKTQWNINAYLKRFFADPVLFRNVQAATGALIVKRVALGFFERRIIETSEKGVDLTMCIVVENGPNADAVQGYLKEEGYLMAHSVKPDVGSAASKSMQKRAIVQTSSFTRTKGASANRRLRISVEHCKAIPEQAFAKGMICTNMGHFIAWNRAYCLFPLALENKVTYLTARTPGGNETWQQQRRQELLDFCDGFTLRTASSVKQLEKTSKQYKELGPVRQFGDRFSWIVNLDVQEINLPKKGFPTLDFATLTLQVPMSRHAPIPPDVAPFLKINAKVMETVAFRHRYLLPTPIESPDVFPASYSTTSTPETHQMYMRYYDLVTAMKEAALLQFGLLHDADRPTNFRAFAAMTEVLSSDGQFTAPQWWSYHDKALQDYLLFLRGYIESR